jgi:di/tripeptidase
LGADDGIGIAMIMSIFADKHFKNIPLEALITSREETGM